MWKDFFYYSKSERRSILVLVGIGILLLVSGTWIHMSRQSDLLFVDSLRLDSFVVRDYQRSMSRDSLRWRQKKQAYVTPVLSNFDPNTVDSTELCRLGLPSFMARRIVHYREKGGLFRNPEDLSRIYGLSKLQFQTLKPYIVIDKSHLAYVLEARRSHETSDSSLAGRKSDSVFSYTNRYRVARQPKYPEGTVLDLNLVDTLQLQQVPGIGSGLAKMIIAYRNRLGGYTRVDQLQEVAQLDVSINRWFKIESPVFRMLRVNRAGLDQLRNHPYMNFYKAKVILEFRRKRGKIKGLSQLSMFQEFSEKDLQKLKPYLDFE